MTKNFIRLYSEEELPAEFKLYLPVQQKGGHQVGLPGLESEVKILI